MVATKDHDTKFTQSPLWLVVGLWVALHRDTHLPKDLRFCDYSPSIKSLIGYTAGQLS